MDKMDMNAIKLGTEVIEPVQLTLLRPPVELVGPVRQHVSQILKVGALLPNSTWCLIRPACVANAASQIRQYLFINPD